MKPEKIRRFILAISIGVFLIAGVQLSDATEIKFLKVIYGKSIEREAKTITRLALLDSSKGRVHEAIDGILQGRGPQGRIGHEAAGRVAAVGRFAMAQIDRQRGKTILSLSKAKARTADIVAREEGILGPAAIQKRIEAMKLANAQREQIIAEEAKIGARFDAKVQQAAFVKRIVGAAQLNWATGEMGKGVFATLQEKNSDPIPNTVVDIVQSKAGFGHLNDFRLGLALLSEERGRPLAHLVPSPVTPKPSRAINYAGAGWGGFAEYGFFSLVAFAYVMWMFCWSMTDLERHVGEEEEQPYEYRKAA